MPERSLMIEVARLISQNADKVRANPEIVKGFYESVTGVKDMGLRSIFTSINGSIRGASPGYQAILRPGLEVLKGASAECADMAIGAQVGAAAAEAGAGASATAAGARAGGTVARAVGMAVGTKIAIGAAVLIALGIGTYYGARYLGDKAGDKPVQPGPAMAGRTVERPAGRDPTPSPDAAATTWCVWYADNINLKPVLVTTKKDYLAERMCNTYPGGGRPDRPTQPMQKVLLLDGYPNRKAAAAEGLKQFTGVRRAGSTFVYTEWLGDHAGQMHDIDELK